MLKKAGAAIFGKSDEKDDPEKSIKIKAGLAQLHQEAATFVQKRSIAKADAENVAKSVKSKNPVFVSITVTPGEETWDYTYVASPPKTEKGEIPRRLVKITIADLVPPVDSVKPGSWDVSFHANVGGVKALWGMVHAKLGSDPSLPPPKPDHSMYLNNELILNGEPVKLRLENGSFTEYALKESISLFEKRYGELKELHGTLILKNLANFQREFSIRRKQEMDNEPAAQQAIRAIPFGAERIKLGYTTFEIKRGAEKIMNIEGIGNSYVPTSVNVIVKK